MTHITIKREVLELAIEAFETIQSQKIHSGIWATCEFYKNEFRMALEAKDVQPVAYLAWRDGKPCYEGDDAVCEDAVWPVDSDDDRTSMPVYRHPAPDAREPLTDEQIYEMYNEPRSDAEMVAFARAIETAHGIRKENT